MEIRVAKSVVTGLAGGAVFVFLFPKGAITTLVHDVLGLPGPGAGIALIKGPMAIGLSIFAAFFARHRGAAAASILSYSLVVVLAVQLVGIAMNPKGMFGSGWFVLVFVVLAGFTELLMWLTGKWKPPWRCLVTAVGANLFLMATYCVVVFPQSAGWVATGHIPVLAAVTIGAGLITGVLAWLASRLV
jgi:hypothetical protein